jgi:prepilin-type N-terminal cleavage/methylation domain
MMRKKMNNKGFSLVELIVVMAIMAILAVTLAPRLMHYVEKARKASDQEVINTILSVASLSMVDENMRTDFDAVDDATHVLDLTADTDADATHVNSFYTTTDGKNWNINTANPPASLLCYNEMKSAVGNFKLKSSDADTDTRIKITFTSSTDTVTVSLYYDNVATPSYTISSR